MGRADGHLLLKNRTSLDFETVGKNTWAKPGFFSEPTTNGYRLVIASHIPSGQAPWEIGNATSNAVRWGSFEHGVWTGLSLASNLLVNGKVDARGYAVSGQTGKTAVIMQGTNTPLYFRNGILVDVK